MKRLKQSKSWLRAHEEDNLLEDAQTAEESSTDDESSKRVANAFDFVTSTSNKRFIPRHLLERPTFPKTVFSKVETLIYSSLFSTS